MESREDADLREWFAGEAAARGMELVDDRAGNLWAWWGDPDADGPGLVLGSHLDSVPDGGADLGGTGEHAVGAGAAGDGGLELLDVAVEDALAALGIQEFLVA